MRPLTILTTLLFIAFGSLLQSCAKPESAPSIDVESIIAGLAQTESLLQSGKGHFKLYGDSYFRHGVEQLVEGVHTTKELGFAFSGKHSYFKYERLPEERQLPSVAGFKPELPPHEVSLESISDGKIQLKIVLLGDNASPYITMHPEPYNTSTSKEPRNWGLWNRGQRMSAYLRELEGVRVMGSERINGIHCYILEASPPQTQGVTEKFWIASEGGFRLVQRLIETRGDKRLIKIEWEHYQLGEANVWFPKHGVSLSTTVGEKTPFRNEMEINDFQPNIDVSSLFDLQISPETQVFNADTRKHITFQEIGWQPLEKTSK